MVNTKGLSFSYAPENTFLYPDRYAGNGHPLLLIGKSGSGKTTLLHLLAGLLRPAGGQLLVNNTDIALLSDRALDRFRGKHIGIIYQRAHFIAALNVKDNILLSPYFSGNPIDTKKAVSIAEQLGIGHLLHKRTTQISQGEQQRVSIARALLNEPKVLLADEPTSSLDDENCEQVIRLLLSESLAARVALIVVSHDERLQKHFSHITSLS